MKVYKQAWFWLLVGIVVFLINQLPLLTDMRPVMYDEAWYANTGYHFSQGDGFLNTIVGSRGNSNYLLPTLTGIMFWIFGYSLFAIRLTAVLCGVLTMIFLHFCLKELKSSLKAEIAVMAIFVTIALYNTIFRFGRPECASIMCMTGGIWFFLRYMRENSWGNMIGLACFTFLATIGHPYALLFFALAGAGLLYQTIREKKWINMAHLVLLMIAAIVAIGSIAWVSKVYNGEGEDYVSARFSMSNIGVALPIYMKEFLMSKHTIYMLPLLLVMLWNIRSKEAPVRALSIIGVVYFALFPFLFSTDLVMIGLGIDYVAILGTVVIAPCVDYVCESRWSKVSCAAFAIYCLLNLGISYYFNYKVKYEPCNTVLQKELRAIIPPDAIVYTPLRQYPMLLENRCYSDHYCRQMPEAYDYIVINSQDEDRYENTIEIKAQLDQYDRVYEKYTKQYGVIEVFRKK